MRASPTASVTNANGSQRERRNCNHLFLLPPERRGYEFFDKLHEDLTGHEMERERSSLHTGHIFLSDLQHTSKKQCDTHKL